MPNTDKPSPPAFGLTVKQRLALDYIRSREAKGEPSPSFDELKVVLGLKSKSGVCRVVKSLEQRGAIRRLKRYTRSIHTVAAS